MDDYKSEAILYILETCGDIEKNLYDCEDKTIIIRMLINRVRILLLQKMVGNLRVDATQRSIETFYTRRDKKEYIVPSNDNTEDKALEAVIDDTMEAKIMCQLIRKFEEGMEKQELLASVQAEFGISKETLLALLSKRLELKKKSRETKDISIQ